MLSSSFLSRGHFSILEGEERDSNVWEVGGVCTPRGVVSPSRIDRDQRASRGRPERRSPPVPLETLQDLSLSIEADGVPRLLFLVVCACGRSIRLLFLYIRMMFLIRKGVECFMTKDC